MRKHNIEIWTSHRTKKKKITEFCGRDSTEIIIVELQLSGRWLSGPPIIRIGLAIRVNLSRILQKELVWKLPVIGSNTIQYYGF